MAPRPAPLDPPLPVDRRFREYADGRRPEVLGEVFETVAPELLAVGRCMGLDEHLAQDALQETFLVLIRRAGEFRPERSFLPWATGIFVRQASSARRRAARLRQGGRGGYASRARVRVCAAPPRLARALLEMR